MLFENAQELAENLLHLQVQCLGLEDNDFPLGFPCRYSLLVQVCEEVKSA
ncbi:MAG: hypothetical protein K9G65_06055 [Rickettsiaceae bacterium]|nr:hypothetical protein [Rickettsiaceae bacterium]